MDQKKHWEKVYAEKTPEEVSWYQSSPNLSLKMIATTQLSLTDPIIDIGCGASTLLDHLVTLGYSDITVLDISKTALSCAQKRLGEAGKNIRWEEANICAFKPQHSYILWHDRAVFHFLTDPGERAQYLQVLNSSLAPGGYVILATFALDGPEKCSGLPVQRYSSELLKQTLGGSYQPLLQDQEIHRTPAGREQKFIYTLFKKSSEKNNIAS